jgi:terminase small subunit / prophage DNA-packing protein
MKLKLDEDTVATAAQLAWLLGVSDRIIRTYAARGLAVRAGSRGRYVLGQSIRRIHAHVAETAAGRSGSELTDARAKLALAQMEGQALRNASLRGEVVSKADMIDTGRVALRGVRQMMLAWPGKAAFEIPTLSAADRAVLERLVRDDLQDASLGRGFGLPDDPAKDEQP